MTNPTEEKCYLISCYEWVGLRDQKPDKPHWTIRPFEKGKWGRRLYTFDTGGYENFELVGWFDLDKLDDLLANNRRWVELLKRMEEGIPISFGDIRYERVP